MVQTDITEATSSDYTNAVDDYAIDIRNIDGATDQKETEWTNANWSKYWGYFNSIPDLKSAIIMKAIWDVGRGYETDPATEVILDHVSGWGKDSFEDILFNMCIIMRIGGDAFAEIIKEGDKIINIKPLDPGSIKIVVDGMNRIKRYEQTSKTDGKTKTLNIWQPEEILHLSNNRLANQIHGISDIEALEKTILADEESLDDIKKLMHHQVKPFIMWKLKTSDKAKIAELVSKIDSARNLGEDMFIPDDDDAIEWEQVNVNLSQLVLTWRDDIRNRFYRTIMLPQIVPGAAGQGTESESKVIFLAFEQIVHKDQKFLEKQIWNQLFLKIDLVHPTSIAPELATDEAKDAGQGLNIQPNETTAGVGE